MRRRGIQLSVRHRRWFYSVTGLLFLSGAAWVMLDWLAGRDEQRTEFLRSLKSGSLKLHGAAAMAFLVALGILIPTHIKRAWQARRNRWNGALFVATVTLLVTTGYGLYYFGDEGWRSTARWVHLVIGLASPALLWWHVWVGRRSTIG